MKTKKEEKKTKINIITEISHKLEKNNKKGKNSIRNKNN